MRRSSLLVLLVAAVVLTGCASSEVNKAGEVSSKPTRLVLADCENDLSNVAAFGSAVRKLSGGSLEVDVHAGNPGNPSCERNLIKHVQAGRTPLGVVPSRAFDLVGLRTFEALQAPSLVDSVALERRVLDSSIAGKMLAGLRRVGLVGLVILPGALRRPVGVGRRLLTPSDFRGARIGITPSGVSEEIVRALGAVPVASSDNANGVDGLETYVMEVDLVAARPDVFVTGNVVLEPRPNVIFINRKAFESLRGSQQKLILRAAALARASASVYEADQQGLADICRRGVKIVDASKADVQALETAERPVYRLLEANRQTRRFIEEISAMRRASGDRPDAVHCPRALAVKPAATSASELDGEWAASYTRKEFRAAGAYSDEVNVTGNWGHFTLTIRHGQWIQRGSIPNSGGSGTFVVRGDEIFFHRHDRAYAGSDTEVWGPYIWSVYGDTLTFKKVSRYPEIPTGLVVEPWRRIGGG